ncbi:MAG: hypothetical protein ACE5JG_04650 [Planctomycetota bacterium]
MRVGRVLKRLGIALAAVVALLLAAFVWMDEIAEAAIERGGEAALGVETSLDAADVGVFGGRLALRGLRVANPEGFRTEHLLALREGSVAVSLGSLLGDRVEVPHLTLAGVSLILERHRGRSNYRVVLRHVRRFEGEEEPEEGRRFIIREVVVRDVTVTADLLPVGGSLTRVKLTIPEIRLHNVGSDSGGVLLAELMARLLKSILVSALHHGQGVLPSVLQQELGGALKSLGTLGGLGVEFGGELGKTARSLGIGEAGKVVEGLGGLLNKKKGQKGE